MSKVNAGRPMLPPKWIDLLPEDMDASERAALKDAIESGAQARAVRLNKISIDELTVAFPSRYEMVPWSEQSYFLSADHGLGKHIYHATGAYYLQEPSAMAAIGALDVWLGQRILDLCAAPGGKSGQIAARLNGQGVLVSNEPFPDRMRVLRGNLVRLGVTNSLMLLETPDRLAERYPATFDRVLVDAPCSGEGLFRREPAARLEWSEAYVKGCAKRQRAILHAAQSMVRPGGLMVYSTCTFNRIENEEVVRAFLCDHPNYIAEDFNLPSLPPSTNGMLRLMPHMIAGEGQFIAKFRRQNINSSAMARLPDDHVSYLSRKENDAFGRFIRDVLPGWQPNGTIIKYGERLCMINESFDEMWESASACGLNVKGIGLELGTISPEGFQPAKAFAMAIKPSECAHIAELGEDEAQAWLDGKAARLGQETQTGWALAVYKNLPLGFGIVEHGRINGAPGAVRPKSLMRQMDWPSHFCGPAQRGRLGGGP